LSTAAQKPYKRVAKLMAILFLFILLVVVFGVIHTIVKNKFKIDTNAQVYIAIAAAFSLLFILLLFIEKRSHSITSIIERILTNIKR
jgi:hypothetical protein